MAELQLFGHPFSSYCQKAIIAFYENDIPFTLRKSRPTSRIMPLNGPGYGPSGSSLC